MLCGLPADQCATGPHAALGDPGHDRGDPLRFELAAGDVVLQEQRLGTAGHQIVGHHGDQIDADGVVHVHRLGDRGLGPDAVGGGREHRVAEAVDRHPEQRREPADATDHLGPVGLLRVRLHQVDGGLTGGDGHSGTCVGGSGTERVACGRHAASCLMVWSARPRPRRPRRSPGSPVPRCRGTADRGRRGRCPRARVCRPGPESGSGSRR